MPSVRSGRSFATAIFAFVAASTLFPSRLAAQDVTTPPGSEISLTSNFGNPVKLEKKSLHLVPALAGQIELFKNSKPAFSANFSSAKSPCTSIDVFVAEQSSDDETSTLSFVFRCAHAQQISWFVIDLDPKVSPALDYFQRTKGDTGPDTETDPANDSGPGISLALGDKSVPIFKLTWWQHDVGASTTSDTEKVLILDFRSRRPSVLAALQGVSAEGGGACGVYDNDAASTTSLSCSWDAGKSDFHCISTQAPLSHRFYLESGKPDPYVTDTDKPSSLEAFGSGYAYPNPPPPTDTDIPGIGRVTLLARYSRPESRYIAVLLASRGTESDSPRYYAVIVDPQYTVPPVAFEILPQSLLDPPVPFTPDASPVAPDTRGFTIPLTVDRADKFTDDEWPSFHVDPFESTPDVSVWQVTAKQGTFHEVVWLAAGANPRSGRLVFSALRMASESQDYAACGSSTSVPFAASITREKGSLDAVLDVEPSHQYDLQGDIADSGDQGQPVTKCPVRLKVSWNPTFGFIRDESNPDCPSSTQSRTLSISDSGVITAKPASPPAEP